MGGTHNRGSTGSLSSASTPNTHSWTRRSGSWRTNRSSASMPSANSRSASDAWRPSPRAAQPLEVLRRGVLRAVDDAQVLAAAALHGGCTRPRRPRGDEVERLDHHAFAAARRSVLPPADAFRLRSPGRSRRRLGKGWPAADRSHRRGRAGQRLHVPDVVLVGVDVPFVASR